MYSDDDEHAEQAEPLPSPFPDHCCASTTGVSRPTAPVRDSDSTDSDHADSDPTQSGSDSDCSNCPSLGSSSASESDAEDRIIDSDETDVDGESGEDENTNDCEPRNLASGRTAAAPPHDAPPRDDPRPENFAEKVRYLKKTYTRVVANGGRQKLQCALPGCNAIYFTGCSTRRWLTHWLKQSTNVGAGKCKDEDGLPKEDCEMATKLLAELDANSSKRSAVKTAQDLHGHEMRGPNMPPGQDGASALEAAVPTLAASLAPALNDAFAKMFIAAGCKKKLIENVHSIDFWKIYEEVTGAPHP